MSNIFDATGLTVETVTQITDDLTTGLQGIYGADINVDSNSPDGQLIGIFAQAIADQLELLVQINNSFDPARAIGTSQDERYQINNITRAGGTFTIQPIDLVINATCTLQGLDAAFDDINGVGYTVQDNAGNKFILVDSETFTPGTYSRNFRAQTIGQVETTVDTITNPVTIILGVTSVNNSSAPLSVGINQEQDSRFRIRQQQSPAINSSGYLNGLLAVILNLTGVIDAKVYENVDNSTDANGIPAHGIWLIVEGGANTDIANILYIKKSYGAPMKGDVVIDIITASGVAFLAQFDRPTPETLYIKFEIQTTILPPSFDEVSIKAQMAANLIYSIGSYASTAEITVVAQAAITSTGGRGVPINIQISSDGVTYVDYLVPTTLDAQFTVDPTRIDITSIIS